MREFKPGIIEFRTYDKTDVKAVYQEFKYRSDVVSYYQRRLKRPWDETEKVMLEDILDEAIVWYEVCNWDLDRLVECEYDGTIPAFAKE